MRQSALTADTRERNTATGTNFACRHSAHRVLGYAIPFFVLASVSSLLPVLFSLLSFKRFVYLLNSSGLQGGPKKRARCTTEEGNIMGLFHQAQFAIKLSVGQAG